MSSRQPVVPTAGRARGLAVPAACCVAMCLAAASAWAGRPLSTEDAATADAGSCQVEAWQERAGRARNGVLSPACGLAPGVEIDADSSWPTPRDTVRQQAGLALKLALPAWRLDTAAGVLNLGVKLGGAWVKPAGGPWQGSGASALGVATLKATEQLAMHLNAGALHDRASGARAAALNGALAWAPRACCLVFVEAQGSGRQAVFGGTVRATGGRWWLLRDRLGLDLTASREHGSGAPTRYTAGLGWYGIGS